VPPWPRSSEIRVIGTSGPLAAVGFCFGGLAVLTMAPAGADLAGVVSIHGSLGTPAPAQPGAVLARILVCHGARDPHVPLTQVTAFAEEMEQAGADWQMILYGGAMHGFTHSRPTPAAVPGVAYDAAADHRSFAAARAFLAGLATHGRAGTEVPHGLTSATACRRRYLPHFRTRGSAGHGVKGHGPTVQKPGSVRKN
jgi:Dienelactone hydrolase family